MAASAGLRGWLIATQRLAKLAKNVAAEASNFLMGRTFLDIDMARAADLLGMERRQADAFRDLERGQFMALGPALSRRPLQLHIGQTETAPRNATPRLMPLPEALEDARAIVLAAPPPEISRASAPAAARHGVENTVHVGTPLRRLLDAERLLGPFGTSLQSRGLRRHKLVEEVRQSRTRDSVPPGVFYQKFVVRCRIEGLRAAVPDLSEFRRMLTRARAGLGADLAYDDAWRDVAVPASVLPEDIQGVFMMIARAAKEGRPCPGDAAIARAYGSRSLRRAQRLLTYI
ncbi:MAG: hypothetical protein WAN86_19620 [Hyphomicrobiaceae bacterium]